MNVKRTVSVLSAAAVLVSAATAFANTTLYTLNKTEKETRVMPLLTTADFADGIEAAAEKMSCDDLGEVMPKLDGWSYNYAVADGTTSESASVKQSDLKVNSGGIKLLGINANQETTGAASLTFTPSRLDDYTEPNELDKNGEYTVFYRFTIQAESTGTYDLSDEAAGRYVAIGLDVSGVQSTTQTAKIADTDEHSVYITYRTKPSTEEDTTRDWAEVYVDDALVAVKGANIADATGIYILTPYNGGRSANVQISDFSYGLVNDKADEPAATKAPSGEVEYADRVIYRLDTTEKETRVMPLLTLEDFADGVETAAAKMSTRDLGEIMKKLDGWGYNYAAADGTTSESESFKQSDLKVNSGGIKLLGINANQTTTGGAALTFTPSFLDNYTEPSNLDKNGEYTIFYEFTVQAESTGTYDLSDAAAGRYVAIGLDVSGVRSTMQVAKIADTKEHKIYITYRTKPSTEEDTTRDWAEIYVDDTLVAAKGVNIADATGVYILAPYSGGRSANVQISNFSYGIKNDVVQPGENPTNPPEEEPDDEIVISYADGKYTAAINIENTNENDLSVSVIVAHYLASGELADIAIETYSIAAHQPAECSAELSAGLGEGDYIKAFAWSEIGDLKPIAKAAIK